MKLNNINNKEIIMSVITLAESPTHPSGSGVTGGSPVPGKVDIEARYKERYEAARKKLEAERALEEAERKKKRLKLRQKPVTYSTIPVYEVDEKEAGDLRFVRRGMMAKADAELCPLIYTMSEEKLREVVGNPVLTRAVKKLAACRLAMLFDKS